MALRIRYYISFNWYDSWNNTFNDLAYVIECIFSHIELGHGLKDKWKILNDSQPMANSMHKSRISLYGRKRKTS